MPGVGVVGATPKVSGVVCIVPSAKNYQLGIKGMSLDPDELERAAIERVASRNRTTATENHCERITELWSLPDDIRQLYRDCEIAEIRWYILQVTGFDISQLPDNPANWLYDCVRWHECHDGEMLRFRCSMRAMVDFCRAFRSLLPSDFPIATLSEWS